MRGTRRAGLVIAGMLAAVGVASTPAHAGAPAGNLTVQEMRGSWVGTSIGFASNDAQTNQVWMTLTRINGLVVIGQQKTRSCAGRMDRCRQRDTSGGGWSAPVRVALALLTDDQVAGADRSGTYTGFVQGDGSIELAYLATAEPTVSQMRLVRVD